MSSDFKNLMRTQYEEVKLRDGFWLNMYEQYSTHTINFMFDMFERSLYVNQFISSIFDSKIGENEVKLIQETNLPLGNYVKFKSISAKGCTLFVRKPYWANNYSVKLNDKNLNTNCNKNDFIEIVLDKGEHEIELTFNYEVIRIHQDFEKDNVGKVTIQYGPLVYCAESIDNFDFENPTEIVIDKNGDFKIIEDGKTLIRKLDNGKDINIRLIC